MASGKPVTRHTYSELADPKAPTTGTHPSMTTPTHQVGLRSGAADLVNNHPSIAAASVYDGAGPSSVAAAATPSALGLLHGDASHTAEDDDDDADPDTTEFETEMTTTGGHHTTDVHGHNGRDSPATGGGGSASTGHGKRKRVVLSIHEKQQVLQRLELGEQPVGIAREFGISRQQVSDIKKNKDRILSFCIDAKHLSSLRRKTLKATSEYHPGVEQELYRWLIRQRRLGRSVTSDMLNNKVTDLFLQYSAEDPGNSVHSSGGAQGSLKAISNWLRHFKRAHNVKTLSEDELLKLPDKFVPAMDMFRTIAGSQASSPSFAGANSTTGAVATGSVDDVSTYINGSQALFQPHGYGHMHPAQPLTGNGNAEHLHHFHHQQQQAAHPSHGHVAQKHQFHATIDTIDGINAQLSYFEREMNLKLDFLDARVEKICFTVLAPRFT